MHVLSLTAGRQTIIIRTNTPGVTDWAAQYFGRYWKTTPADDSTPVHGPVVTAVDGDHQAPTPVTPTHHATFAREPIGYTRHPDNTVTAHTQTDPAIAFRYTPDEQHLHISSHQALQPTARPGRPTPLATATTRFAREMMRARLIADGWVLLHASAAVLPGGHTLLTLGDSGAGKTTTALTLASTGAGLLANDCCFARPNTAGGLDLLPWPAAAAVGIGLLHALHLADSAGTHLNNGEPPHPTQDQQVTDALITGRTGALTSTSGRELKAHIWPEQLTRWFGMPLANTGIAAGVLLPRFVSSSSDPACVDGSRHTEVTSNVFVTSDEDRYPDLFGFTGGDNAGTPEARHEVLQRLNRLPRHVVDLSHDQAANTQLLATLAASLRPHRQAEFPADLCGGEHVGAGCEPSGQLVPSASGFEGAPIVIEPGATVSNKVTVTVGVPAAVLRTFEGVPEPPEHLRTLTIGFFGTSIMEHLEAVNAQMTTQANLPEVGSKVTVEAWVQRGWVHRLVLSLRAAWPHIGLDVRNHGEGGATSRDIAGIVEGDRATTGTDYDLAFLGCGINDVWRRFQNRTSEAVDLDEYTRHINAMLTQLGGYTRTIIVVSETPFGPVEDPGTVTEMNLELARYNDAARTAATAHGALFLDVWSPFTAAARHLATADADGEGPGGLWSDGVHLTELGDTVLLQQAEQLLAEHRVVKKLLDYPLLERDAALAAYGPLFARHRPAAAGS